MASNNPAFELGFLDDFKDLETCPKWLQKHRKRRKFNKAKVLPAKKTASQIYPRKILKDKQSNKTKQNTDVFPRSRVSFKLK